MTRQLIVAIWGDNIQNNTVDNISPEVIRVVSDTLEQIDKCSDSMVYREIILSLGLYPPAGLADILFAQSVQIMADWNDPRVRDPFATYKQWYNGIFKQNRYESCIKTAARNYRTRLEEALLGI